MDWLRWYHGTATDPKWRVIAKLTGVHVTAVGMIWATMLESASQNPERRGVLSGWVPEEIAAALDLEEAQVQSVFEALQKRCLEDSLLISWDKRNPKRERDDDSTERVKRHREKGNTKKHHVTPKKNSNATKRLDKRRVEERRKEGNEKSPILTNLPNLETSSSSLKPDKTDDDKGFIQAVRVILRELPHAEHVIVNPKDIAKCLHSGIALATIESGCWLGMGRHLASSSAAIPIRTFSFFIPIIEEIHKEPPAHEYLKHVKAKVQNAFRPAVVEVAS